MLDARRAQVFQQQSVVGDMNFDDVAVASQVEVLKSANVARAVVAAQRLLEDSEFNGQRHGAVGLVLDLARALAARLAPPPADPTDELTRAAVRTLRDNLSVQRVGRTYVIEISFTSLDQLKSARISNALAEAYLLDQQEAKSNATRQASSWLQERMAELRDEATRSDRAVQDFRERNQLVEASGRTVTDQQLGEINTQLVSARARTAEARARLERVSEVKERGFSAIDAFRNEALVRLRQQWIEASRREGELSSRYGSDHLAAANLRQELERIQRLISDELRRMAEIYGNEHEVARDRERALEASLGEAMGKVAASKQAQVTLRMLESSAQSYRALYDSFLTRFVETTQQQSLANSEARIITRAASGERSGPRALSVMTFAVVGGLAIAVAAALGREQLDRTFRLPAQVETVLGLPCLGILPAASPRTPPAVTAHAGPPTRGERLIPRDLGIGRHVVVAPFSRFAETLRAARVAADTSAPAGHVQVVGISSAVPGEGKSTVALNLAALASQGGARTLLIDGDLRNPALTRLVSPGATAGLLQILERQAELSDVTWTDPVTGMRFLPAVVPTRLADTSGLISSAAMGRLISAAREAYDVVVVDLPPMAPVVDALAAAPLLDGFLLVIAWGDTSAEIVVEALNSADLVRRRTFGILLNKADPKRLRRLEAYKGVGYHRYHASVPRIAMRSRREPSLAQPVQG